MQCSKTKEVLSFSQCDSFTPCREIKLKQFHFSLRKTLGREDFNELIYINKLVNINHS